MIRRFLTCLTLFICVVASVTSCHRQKLEEILYTKALIPVLIDWQTGALMDIENDPDEDLYSASVWLFPRAESQYQGDPIEYRLDNAIYDYLDVPIGVYDVLVFNKTVGEYSSNVGFRGMDKFDTFEYYTKPYVSADSKNVMVDDKELRLEPDLLAAWRSAPDKPFVVTLEMIQKIDDIILCRDKITNKFFSNSKSEPAGVVSKGITPEDFAELDEDMRQLINLIPERLTHIIPTREYVYSLHSASKSVGTLCGMSSSVKMAHAEYSPIQTAYRFLFETKTFTSEDKKDGYMDAEYRVIGPLHRPENPIYELKSVFTLHKPYNDNTTYPTPPDAPFSFAVTDQVFDGESKMGLDKVIPVEISFESNITLPDVALPGSGFDVNLNDWDDEIDVPL